MAFVMNRAGHEFLSGPAFSREQHRHVAVRDHFDQTVHALHWLALSDHLVEARPDLEAILELLVFTRQRVALEGFLNHDRKPFTIDRFRNIVVGSASHVRSRF